MLYNTINVKYWQQDDNKCQFWGGGFAVIMITSIFSTTYDNIGLAQKLHYFWSPIKKHLLVKGYKSHQE